MAKSMAIYEFLMAKGSTHATNYLHGLTCGKNVTFTRRPHISLHPTARIVIGANTIINSSNFGYHINMHSKCKLYADRENAVIEIGENCRIHGTCIHAFKRILIGDNCLIAANTQIIDGNGHQLCMSHPEDRLTLKDEGKEIIIEDNVWIAANCIILGGAHIKTGSVITAGSVVKGVIESNSLYGGNPAILIRRYDSKSDHTP